MQRRLRWLTALAVGSLAGMGMLGVLTVMAMQARNDARHQREQAEGLIEFMLGDLRKKLEPVGRLEVLDSVGEKALAYYGTQDADRLDANALGHRSRALHLIGEIHDLRGNFAEAQAVFERSAATTSQLLAKNPGDPQRLFDHAQSNFWVGYAAWKRADGRAAEQRFKDYLRLSERLSAHDPKNNDWQAEVAFAHINLGTVYVETRRYDAALEALQAAQGMLASLSRATPSLNMELAHVHGWKAIAFYGSGRYEAALLEQQKKLDLLNAMRTAHSDAQAQSAIQTALQYNGLLELAMGHMERAEQTGEHAVRLGNELAAADPSNMALLADACFARVRLAEIKHALGRAVQARELLLDVERCNATLLAADGADERYTVELAGLALALSAHVRPSDPLLVARMDAFVRRTAPQTSMPSPGYVKRAVSVAAVSLALGDGLNVVDNAAARTAWARAERELGPLADGNDGAVLTTLAQAQLRLGNPSAARLLAQRIATTSYRHPAYADLVNRLQATRGAGSSTAPVKGNT
jgi:tetratricopeptide (TPR) repeat protein